MCCCVAADSGAKSLLPLSSGFNSHASKLPDTFDDDQLSAQTPKLHQILGPIALELLRVSALLCIDQGNGNLNGVGSTAFLKVRPQKPRNNGQVSTKSSGSVHGPAATLKLRAGTSRVPLRQWQHNPGGALHKIRICVRKSRQSVAGAI